MEILSKQQFIMELDDVEALFTERIIAEEDLVYRKPHFGLKITSQEDVYQRKKIVNYRAVGLHKPSFIRLEIPIKLEKAQFCYYVGMYGLEKTQKILEEIRKRIKKQMPN